MSIQRLDTTLCHGCIEVRPDEQGEYILYEDHVEFLEEILWRIKDIRDMLMGNGYNGYGLDEWSVPTMNLKTAANLINKELGREEGI